MRDSSFQVVQCILAGELLPKPARCPRELYKLMLQCWAPQPQDRPTFGVIAGVFRRWREAWAAQQTAMSAAPVGEYAVAGWARHLECHSTVCTCCFGVLWATGTLCASAKPRLLHEPHLLHAQVARD